LSTHVRNHLKKWNDAFDLAIWRALGCDVSGAPCSLQQHGERNIPWTQQQGELRRFFAYSVPCTACTAGVSSNEWVLGSRCTPRKWRCARAAWGIGCSLGQ
jgi:hypothetical protein